MKAIFHDRYGSAEVLEFRDLPLPPLGDDEVLVRVHAAGVNRGDGLAVEGIPYAARLTYGLTRPKHNVPGTDVAGQIEAVGKDVTALEPGDDVFGWTTGGFAEYTATRENKLARKPAHLTFEQAAAAPTTGVTALQALRDVGRIEAGHRVLVVGASGGVGSFAVQIAKAFGAEVTGVASTRNIDLVRSTGADHVIDYTSEDFTRHVHRYDLILDMVGKEPLSSSRRALRAKGTYVVVGGQNPRSLTGMGRFAKAVLMSPIVPQRLRPLFSKQNHEDLEALRELLDTGKVLPVIDAVYD
ncbi:MAG: NAD(P)-dependent alcohol dehydrogenase, partial [Actinomycetota bacterium]|nr:NAD(P)-dependent alcohol dehydrogenase [Actinomycetota bacterium]